MHGVPAKLHLWSDIGACSTRTARTRSRQSGESRGSTVRNHIGRESFLTSAPSIGNVRCRAVARQRKRGRIGTIDRNRKLPEGRERTASRAARRLPLSVLRRIPHRLRAIPYRLRGLLDRRRLALETLIAGRRTNASLESPINFERPMRARVLGKERRHAPRLRRSDGSRVQRAVGASRIHAHRRREPAFDLRIDNVGPVSLNADQGRSRRFVECVKRIVATSPGRFFHQFIARLSTRPEDRSRRNRFATGRFRQTARRDRTDRPARGPTGRKSARAAPWQWEDSSVPTRSAGTADRLSMYPRSFRISISRILAESNCSITLTA